MGLVRLLTLGKALSEGKEWPGRYRMPRKNAMPRFGRKQDANLRVGSPDKPRPEFVQPELIPEHAEPTSIQSVIPHNAQATNSAGPLAPTAGQDNADGSCHPEAGWHRVLAMLTAFGRSLIAVVQCAVWLVRYPFRRVPKPPPQARQVDLPRLDAVRVVRNDLTDSDFEVVTRSASTKGTNPFSAGDSCVTPPQEAVPAAPAEPLATRSD